MSLTVTLDKQPPAVQLQALTNGITAAFGTAGVSFPSSVCDLSGVPSRTSRCLSWIELHRFYPADGYHRLQAGYMNNPNRPVIAVDKMVSAELPDGQETSVMNQIEAYSATDDWARALGGH
ncbi:hypothetical protein JB92DRAFT_2824836 [Gautieria morchelliformis]|nr:hypothetical protein JB92DRAFT_2824836 [Gautieria morchelliformis]